MNKGHSYLLILLLVWLSPAVGEMRRLGGSVAAGEDTPQATADYVEGHGTVQPKRLFVYRLGPNETVGQVLVTDGQQVAAGTPLAQLDDDLLEGRIQTLEERLHEGCTAAAQARGLEVEMEVAQERLQRLEKWIKEERALAKEIPDYPARQQLRELTGKRAESRGQLRILAERKAGLEAEQTRCLELHELLSGRQEALQARRGALRIEAPFAGRVRRLSGYPRNLHTGDLLFELWDESGFRVQVDLWQQHLDRVAVGDRASIRADVFGEREVQGRVTELLPVAPAQGDNRYPRFPAVIELDPGAAPLRVGMMVSVRIHHPAGALGGVEATP